MSLRRHISVKPVTDGVAPLLGSGPGSESSGNEGDGPGLITHAILSRALRNALGHHGLDGAGASRLALYVLNFFGYDDAIIDNVLTSEDRDVFYMLEEEGFLKTSQEEVSLMNGNSWRIHYWILQKAEILRRAERAAGGRVKSAAQSPESAIYDEVFKMMADEPPRPMENE